MPLLATAHSPYLLNYLSPEQVRIMAAGRLLPRQTAQRPSQIRDQGRRNGPWRDAEPVRRDLAGRKGDGIVSLQFGVVYEVRADFQTVTELSDRMFFEALDWRVKDQIQYQVSIPVLFFDKAVRS
jgi:hypothetical protein